MAEKTKIKKVTMKRFFRNGVAKEYHNVPKGEAIGIATLKKQASSELLDKPPFLGVIGWKVQTRQENISIGYKTTKQ